MTMMPMTKANPTSGDTSEQTMKMMPPNNPHSGPTSHSFSILWIVRVVCDPANMVDSIPK
jgi:hypothetical protein